MKVTGLGILILTLALVAVPAATADTITLGPGICGNLLNDCGNFTFVIDATGTTASLTITNGNAETWYLQYFTLDLYSGGISATGDPGNTQNGQTFSIFSGNGQNGQPTGGCNGSGPSSAFCVLFNTDGAIAAGASLTYYFTISGGTLDDTSLWHIQALLTELEGGGGQSDRVALSTGPASEVPEPSSLALLGSGLIGIAGAVRRKLAR